MNGAERPQLFISAIALGIALVVCSVVLAWGFKDIRSGPENVVVTGSAKKRIKSDLIKWSAVVKADAAQLGLAYRALTQDVPKVKDYLIRKGIPADQLVVSAIETTAIRERRGAGATSGNYEGNGDISGRTVGYSLRQKIEVRSKDVDKITVISREVTELINQGILIESEQPEYLYTRLGDLKIEMLSEAAKDAKVRAQQIAAATGNKIGAMQGARMGVLQITPADSTEISGYGVNDTTSLEKDITAVVNITFAID